MSARYTGDAERVRAALAVIPAHDYITWVDMAFAVKHGLGEAGFEIWDEWSRGASNYSERAARTIWRSARAAGGTTLGTLFWLAQQHGFNLTGPGMSAVDAAAGVRERLAGQDTIREEWREQEKARTRRAAVAREAASIWQWARPVGPQHPYLVRKQVEPVPTLRELEATELHTLLGYMPKSGDDVLAGRVLIVPVWTGDVLCTLELIDEQGRKSSLAGGAKAGGYWVTAPLPKDYTPSLPVPIAEGVATALSAQLATGWIAVAALSCGNLPRVVQAWRTRYPHAGLLVLAEPGPGQQYAWRAAARAHARLAVPAFAAGARIAGEVPTDFNDMAVLAGLGAVREALRDAAYRNVTGADEGDLPQSGDLAWLTDRWKEGAQMRRMKQDLTGATKEGTRTEVAAAGDFPETPGQEEAGDGARRITSRRAVGAPLYGLDDVPDEIRALAQHRFGAQIRMAVPRENGGPYRGEVFNTEHYLIQEVATRSVVFHAKEHMEFVSERLKWCEANQRLNGADVQIGYDGERAKVYPWDRTREQLERSVASLKRSAQELGLDDDVGRILDQLQAKSWGRVKDARAAALARSRERAAHETPESPESPESPDVHETGAAPDR